MPFGETDKAHTIVDIYVLGESGIGTGLGVVGWVYVMGNYTDAYIMDSGNNPSYFQNAVMNIPALSPVFTAVRDARKNTYIFVTVSQAQQLIQDYSHRRGHPLGLALQGRSTRDRRLRNVRHGCNRAADNRSCLKSDAEIGDNIPFDSVRRADEIVEIVAIVQAGNRREAIAWIIRMQGGTLYYEDNRKIAPSQGARLWTALERGVSRHRAEQQADSRVLYADQARAKRRGIHEHSSG